MRKVVVAGLFLLLLFLPVTCRGQEIGIPNPIIPETFEELAENIMSFFVSLTLALCGLAIVIGAFFILTSGGNPRRYKKGRDVILYALLGLVIILLARGITSLIRYSFGVRSSTESGDGGGDEGSCVDECTTNVCEGDSYRECIEGEDGCLDLGPPQACPDGWICREGNCLSEG